MPAHAEKVTLETSTQGGYARLLFKLSSPSNVKANIDNGVMVVTFDRRLDFDIQKIRKSLPQYVALVRQDNDGRVLRLALTQNYRLHTSSADNRIAIDIIPSRYSGDPEDIKPKLTREEIEARKAVAQIAAEEIARGPVEMRPLKVQVGRRDGYSRVAFAWPEPVEYTAMLENGKIKLTFKQPADPDIVELRIDPPNYVLTAQKTVTDNSLSVEISVIPGVGLRHFRDGNGIVVDVLKPEAKPLGGDAEVVLTSQKTDKQTPSESESDSAVSVEAPEETPEQLLEDETPPLTEVKSEDVAQEAHAVSEQDITGEKAPDDAALAHSVEAVEVVHEEQTPLGEAPQLVKQDSDELKVGMVLDHATEKEEPALAEVQSDQHEDDIDQTSEHDVEAKPVAQETPKVITVSGYDQGDSLRLTFRWERNVAAAFFKRGPFLWMVFDDTATELDFSLVGKEYRQFIHSINSEISGDARVVRLGISDHLLVTALPEEGAWVVTLGEKILRPTSPLELNTVINYRFEPVINIPLEDHGAIHRITDPEVGDELTVVTALGPARGLIAPQKFVEFTTLRSAHGLILRSLSDSVIVRPVGGGIEVSHAKGLTLSEHELQTAIDGHVPLGSQTVPAFMEFDEWQLGSFSEFTQLEQGLHSEVARVSELGDRNVSQLARIKLARFYIAHGMGYEALGILDLVTRQDEEAETDPAFLALRGVANFITRRFGDALNDLNNSSLNEDADAALWRGAIQAELEHFIEARREFSQGMPVLPRYPEQWQDYFHLMAAKAALAVNDIERIEWYLRKLAGENTSSSIQAEAEFIQGEMLEALGRKNEAVVLYAHVMKTAPEPIVAKASFASTSALYQSGKIDVGQAIEDLESLRFQWRGGILELAILQRLGELYVDQGDYRHGLNIMRETVISYPDSPAARKISTSMGDVFKKLFLEETFDDMTPVRALAVYYEFRELTPIGRDGDDMIRKLANRLIGVDLLEQATELLRHQVQNRLRGVARAQVATRLAMVYLMDRKPENALQIIRNTRLAGIPESLVYSRRLLEARSLAELGRYAHALELVEQYHTEETEQIRADIYWTSQDWPKAAVKIEELLGDRWQTEEPLHAEERQNIMRAAVSYSLAEDQVGLTRLRAKFGEKMAESEDASSFEIVTQNIEQQGIEFRKLATSIATTDTLDTFMANFRNQFQMSDVSLN